MYTYLFYSYLFDYESPLGNHKKIIICDNKISSKADISFIEEKIKKEKNLSKIIIIGVKLLN